MTRSRSGTSSAAVASRVVQYRMPLRPSIGGTAGSEPVASTTACRAVSLTLRAAVGPGERHPPLAGKPGPPADQVQAGTLGPLDLAAVVPVVGEGGAPAEHAGHVEPGR